MSRLVRSMLMGLLALVLLPAGAGGKQGKAGQVKKPGKSKAGKGPVKARASGKEKPGSRLTGRQIVTRSLALSEIRDMKGKAVLELTSASGRRRQRVMWLYTKDDKARGTRRMYLRFESPADVRGTAMLMKEYATRSDDIYIYLPSIRRIKRITGSGKGGAFMDSDFNYSDLTRAKLGEWRYRRLADRQEGGRSCYVIECLAASKKVQRETGYWKTIRWIGKGTLSLVRADYLDNRRKVFKRLLVKKTKLFGRLHFATDMLMTDVLTGHKSRIRFKDLETNTGLSDRIFSLRTLLRGR